MRCPTCHTILQQEDPSKDWSITGEEILICPGLETHCRLFVKDGNIVAYRFCYEYNDKKYVIHQLHIGITYLYSLVNWKENRVMLRLESPVPVKIENDTIDVHKLFIKLRAYVIFS